MSPCVVWVAGAAGDLVSTEVALHHGAVELNPIQQTPAGRVGAQAVYAVTGCLVDSHLRKGGRGKLAKGIRIAAFALKMGLMAHNLRRR